MSIHPMWHNLSLLYNSHLWVWCLNIINNYTPQVMTKPLVSSSRAFFWVLLLRNLYFMKCFGPSKSFRSQTPHSKALMGPHQSETATYRRRAWSSLQWKALNTLERVINSRTPTFYTDYFKTNRRGAFRRATWKERRQEALTKIPTTKEGRTTAF